MNSLTPTTADAFELLMQGTVALSQVEAAGIAIDEGYLHKAIRRTEWKIRQLEDSLRESEVYRVWRREYGTKAKLGSRDQLAHVLFDVMKVRPSAVTDFDEEDEGVYHKRQSTNKASLTGVDLPFVAEYEEFDDYRRLRSTYLGGIRRETVDGFVHPVLNLHLVKTGRSSANSPGIHNQFNRKAKMAAILRRCYVPRADGWVLIEPDFGAVEVRAIECYGKDPELLKRLEDPHRDWAAELFFLEPGQVDKKTHRDWAKNRFVFPKFYGSSYRKIAPHVWMEASKDCYKAPCGTKTLREHLADNGIYELGSSEAPGEGTFAAHVRYVEEKFDGLFRASAQWRYDWVDLYRRRGYFDHLTGYRQTGIYSRNDVINHPIQGTAFHWLLWSLIRIQREFRRRRMRALIVSEIHDCLLIDAPRSEVQDVLTICKRVMTEDIREHWEWINCDLIIEADVTLTRAEGGSWHGKKPWIDDDGTWRPRPSKN